MVAMITVGASSARAAKADPLARTEQLLQAFKSVKNAPEGGALSAADRQANEAAFKALDDFFNYERLTSEPVEPNRKAFTAEQLAQFSKMFRELIRLVAYPRSGAFLRDAQVSLGKPKMQGKTALVEMRAEVPAEDFSTVAVFHWEESGGTWKIVDVSFDGSSLVKDYQNQFGRLIKKEGADGLLKKVSARLEDERKATL